MRLDVGDLLKNAAVIEEMWVFGYGSLMWNPGFEYTKTKVGYIEGYTRRFWQGNTTHRGTVEKPGRVATLIEDKNNTVWGRVFQLVGGDQILPCLDHLGLRECKLGGYEILILPVYGRGEDCPPVLAITFIATPTNTWYLGSAPVDAMALDIVSCWGVSGSNVEYIMRVAHFMRLEAINQMEDELRDLEILILVALKISNPTNSDHQGLSVENETDARGLTLDHVFRAVEAHRQALGRIRASEQSKDISCGNGINTSGLLRKDNTVDAGIDNIISKESIGLITKKKKVPTATLR